MSQEKTIKIRICSTTLKLIASTDGDSRWCSQETSPYHDDIEQAYHLAETFRSRMGWDDVVIDKMLEQEDGNFIATLKAA